MTHLTPRDLDLLRLFIKPTPLAVAWSRGKCDHRDTFRFSHAGLIREQWSEELNKHLWQLTPDGHKALKAGGAA